MNKELLNRFKESFSFHVVETDKNPNMLNSENMRHFKVFIKNKETQKERSFIYSIGLGIKETDDDSLIFGLLGCSYMDLPYIDLEVFDGLGYNGKEAIKVYKSICKQYDKIKDLGLLEVLENLTEEEKESLD